MVDQSDKPAPQVQYWRIEADDVGQRIDNYLMRRLKPLPKARIYRMLRSGEVRVDGGRVKPTYRLRAGVELRIPPVRLSAPPPKQLDLRLAGDMESWVIEQNDDYCVLNKPSGLAVHGGSGLSLGLIELARSQWGERTALVHRLDRGTSGVLLLAKHRRALITLQAAFRQRRTNKEYLVWVHGRWPHAKELEVRLPLLRTQTASGERRVRIDHDGQSARTLFTPIWLGEHASCLRARIHTGRTHQIRVHALACGHAVLGDDKYAGDGLLASAQTLGVQRLMLHAESLRFEFDGQRQRYVAPLPTQFTALASALGAPKKLPLR